MPTGKATDMPAMAIAATSRILAALKITPPKKAERRFSRSASRRLARNPRPAWPMLPKVKAKITAISSTPKT